MGFKRKDTLTTAFASGYTYTRTGVGTRYNSSGLETDITADNGRFNHNRTTPFAALGPSFEIASSNNVQYSTALDNAWWAKTGVTLTAVAGFDGANTAFEMLENNGASVSGLQKTGLSILMSSGFVGSVIAKAGTREWIEITINNGTAKRGYFNLSTGSATNSSFTSVGMIDLGDGWYKCWAAITGSSTVATFNVTPRTGANSSTITGDGVTKCTIQRPQLEPGALATTHITTAGGAVSRGLDICQISTPPVDTTQPFAMLVKYSLLPGASAGGPLVFDAAESFGVNSYTGETCKVIRFDGTDTYTYTENGAVTGSVFYAPGAVDLKLGSDGTSALNGCISEVQWWQGAMSDALMLSSASSQNFPASISNSRFGTGSLGLGRVGLGQIGTKH